jgi:hypothetical protein
MWSNTITPIQLNTYTCQNLGSTWSTCKSRDVIGRYRLGNRSHVFVIVLENGRQVDALKLKLPGGEPMKSAKSSFFKTIEPLKFELDSIANL